VRNSWLLTLGTVQDDFSLYNYHWADALNAKVDDINTLERDLLSVLCVDLFLTQERWVQWKQAQQRILRFGGHCIWSDLGLSDAARCSNKAGNTQLTWQSMPVLPVQDASHVNWTE
jgi:hypothetical protein